MQTDKQKALSAYVQQRCHDNMMKSLLDKGIDEAEAELFTKQILAIARSRGRLMRQQRLRREREETKE